MREISVLCGHGDLKINWNPEKPEEVADARIEVERLREAGYSFFVEDGSPADAVAAGKGQLFVKRVDDPIAELAEDEPEPRARRGGRRAVAIPPMRGG